MLTFSEPKNLKKVKMHSWNLVKYDKYKKIKMGEQEKGSKVKSSLLFLWCQLWSPAYVWLMTFSSSSSRLSSGIWGHGTHMIHRHTCLQNTKESISSKLITEQLKEQLSLQSAHRMVPISSIWNKLSRITLMTNDQQTCTLKSSTWNTMNCLGEHINTRGVEWTAPPPHTHPSYLHCLLDRYIFHRIQCTWVLDMVAASDEQ